MTLKKVVTLAAVALLLFYIFSDPVRAGQQGHEVYEGLKVAAIAIVTFLKSLFS